MKIYKLFIAVLILFSAVSCTTMNEITENDKLTEEEYQQLLKKCRLFVMSAPHMKYRPLSKNDKIYIKTHLPKFNPRYFGHKSGTFKMSWTRKQPQHGWSTWGESTAFSVRVYGKGEFLDPSCRLRMSVLKFAE